MDTSLKTNNTSPATYNTVNYNISDNTTNYLTDRIKSAIAAAIGTVAALFLLLANEVILLNAAVSALAIGGFTFAITLIYLRSNSPTKIEEQPPIEHSPEVNEEMQDRINEASEKMKDIISFWGTKRLDSYLKHKAERVKFVEPSISNVNRIISSLEDRNKTETDLNNKKMIEFYLQQHRSQLEKLESYYNVWDHNIEQAQSFIKNEFNLILKDLPKEHADNLLAPYKSDPKYGL